MTVKKVMEIAADLLGEKDVKKYLTGKVPDDLNYCAETAELLKRCYDIITDELACEFLPVCFTETVECADGKAYYSDFSKVPLKIVSVTDENGNKCRYKLFIDYLETTCGKKNITYRYRPEIQSEDDEAIYASKSIGEFALAYGIAAEYCMHRGRTAESAEWGEKYYRSVKGRIAERRNLKIPARRWL